MQQQQSAFDKLKKCIVKLPELAHPDNALPYDIHSDASNIGIGAVLVQRGRPIASESRTLIVAERNYSTTEKECMAVVWALEQFHPYVHGADFTVFTDHVALRSILTNKTPLGRIARWIMTIQAYKFTVQHKKGSLNGDADAPSRIQNSQRTEPDLLLTKKHLEISKAETKLLGLLENRDQAPFNIKHGTLFHGKPPVVVLPARLPNTLLWQIHDHPTAGHLGRVKTRDKARQLVVGPTWTRISPITYVAAATCVSGSRQLTPRLANSTQ